MKKKNNLISSSYPIPDGHPTRHRPRRNYWGNLYDEDTFDENRHHFTTDCDNLKLSTIHSFKGWEAETVILLLQPEMGENSTYEGYYIQERENTPALIYTALTRAKCNLFIINLGNNKYHQFFQSNV